MTAGRADRTWRGYQRDWRPPGGPYAAVVGELDRGGGGGVTARPRRGLSRQPEQAAARPSAPMSPRRVDRHTSRSLISIH